MDNIWMWIVIFLYLIVALFNFTTYEYMYMDDSKTDKFLFVTFWPIIFLILLLLILRDYLKQKWIH